LPEIAPVLSTLATIVSVPGDLCIVASVGPWWSDATARAGYAMTTTMTGVESWLLEAYPHSLESQNTGTGYKMSH